MISITRTVLHKDLVFINWHLASLESFGEEDPFFIKWRSFRHCLQSEWALDIFLQLKPFKLAALTPTFSYNLLMREKGFDGLLGLKRIFRTQCNMLLIVLSNFCLKNKNHYCCSYFFKIKTNSELSLFLTKSWPDPKEHHPFSI